MLFPGVESIYWNGRPQGWQKGVRPTIWLDWSARSMQPGPVVTVWAVPSEDRSHVHEWIAHELAQLSDLGRGDPALGQTPEAQHGGQVTGVALVVLHPAIAPVVPERVSKVHMGAELLERVSRPIPAIGGFEDHLGLGPSSGHGLGELEGLLTMRSVPSTSPSSAIR